jgi:site-specific recombinase XerC
MTGSAQRLEVREVVLRSTVGEADDVIAVLLHPSTPHHRLTRASVPAGHPAGQRVLDKTHGSIMAVKTLLGHSSISTTADIYTDWNIDQLADTLREILDAEAES